MNFSGFEGTDSGIENASEVTSSVEKTDSVIEEKELEMPELEPVEIQDEVNEANESSFDNFNDEMNFDQLELEEPEILEDSDEEDADVFGETSSGASKSALELGDEENEGLEPLPEIEEESGEIEENELEETGEEPEEIEDLNVKNIEQNEPLTKDEIEEGLEEQTDEIPEDLEMGKESDEVQEKELKEEPKAEEGIEDFQEEELEEEPEIEEETEDLPEEELEEEPEAEEDLEDIPEDELEDVPEEDAEEDLEGKVPKETEKLQEEAEEKLEESLEEKVEDTLGEIEETDEEELKEASEETDEEELREVSEEETAEEGLQEVPEEDTDRVSKYEARDVEEHTFEILEQFDAKEETFESAMDGENSEKFVENCSETLDRLNEQKETVKSAKDLKFQEIYNYVTKNNMDRFDTAYDPYYQHLIAEYKAMQQQDDEIRSHVNTIDAQAMSVAYYQELAYESKANDLNRNPFLEQAQTDEIKENGEGKEADEETKEMDSEEKEAAGEIQEANGEGKEIDEKAVELPPEIAEGTDDPETTDYFVDEVRAKETLESFANDKWENLEPDEKKMAIDKLAEYSQDILGLKEPVKIEYYANDVPGDYGGFDKEKNTLFINEKNLQDGPETADTIAHEMRHAYQYMRAEELETNRDLAFAGNFARYIRPEQNQSAYETQIVEKDAALYAQRFRTYAESLNMESLHAESPNAGSLEGLEETAGEKPGGDKSLEIRPDEKTEEKPASRVEKEDSPVSVKKVKYDPEGTENKKYREVFEAEEIGKIKEYVAPVYENAREVGNQDEAFFSYKEHFNIESGHIGKVVEKTCETADDLEKVFAADNYGGLYSPEIDRKTLQMAAFYHDTGMDGNIRAEDYSPGLEKYLDENKGKGTEAELKAEYEQSFRKNHSLQSAVHVLKDREKIQKMGVSPDETAIICFMHSKSCSGLKNLASDGKAWMKALGKIENEVKEYNENHPEEPISFDSKYLCDETGKIDEEKLARMRSSCACIRLGDADGHDYTSMETQGGGRLEVDETTSKVDPLETRARQDALKNQQLLEKNKTGEIPSLAYCEVQDMHITANGVELTNENDRHGMGRIYAAGERNFKELKTEVQTQDGREVLVHSVDLADGNSAVFCTMSCLEERIKEMATLGVAPKGRGEASSDKIRMKQVVHIGRNCSDRVKEEYKQYQAKMYNKWKIQVEIEE